jgi:UMF1 family MFS transporter
MDEKRKATWGWAIYDWANSAFATTVMAGFFPIFFKQYWSAGTDVNVSTAQLGFGNAAASLLVALLAPVLGAIADKGAAKKRFLLLFAYLGVLMTASLFLVQKGAWQGAIFLYVMGNIGFSGANIFYDALLPTVSSSENIDFVSGAGFSLGYLGGGLLFLVNVAMTLSPEAFGLTDASQAVRFSFLTVAVWWGGFTLFTALWVPETRLPRSAVHLGRMIADGLRQIYSTSKTVARYRTAFLFLIAYWFYIDGVHTIIRMAVDYGLSLGFASTDLILALLIVQFVGFPAALTFGKLGQKWSVRRSIYIAIFIYIGITMWGAFMTSKNEFYVMAVFIGLVQGGLQALSRSYYARFIPPGQYGEFYGFYNMLGKFAAILGPALIAVVGLGVRAMLMPPDAVREQAEQIGRMASRASIASVAVLFVIGLVLFFFVDEEKGRKEAGSRL